MNSSLLGGRYHLRGELGRGGMGVVWLAYDKRVDREVAVKILHPWIASDPAGSTRFRREARTLGRLAHQHIVRLYDFDEEDERAFLVMELIDGRALGDLVGERLPLTFPEAAVLLEPAAAALDYAHSRGIVHRDLKPGNILVEKSGRIVVSDFGLARLAEGAHSLTASGMLLGSPEYWAPEQAAGDPITSASDLYALGCVLYQLVSGHLPFEGEDRLALGYRRVHEDPPDVLEYAPDCPADGVALIRGLLAREDPEARPTAGEARAALSRQAAETTETLPLPAWSAQETGSEALTLKHSPAHGAATATVTASRWRGSWLKRALAVGGLLLLLGGGGALATLVLNHRGKTAAPTTRRARTVRETVTVEKVRTHTTHEVQTVHERAAGGQSDSGKGSGGSTPPTGEWRTFTGSHFFIDYPSSWYIETDEESKGSYFDTTIRDPRDPSIYLRVDATPNIAATDPLDSAREVISALERQAGYRLIRLRRTTLNGYDAVWWEFTVPESGVVDHKVDVFLVDSSRTGIAVLTQAPDLVFSSWSDDFDSIRQSLVLYD